MKHNIIIFFVCIFIISLTSCNKDELINKTLTISEVTLSDFTIEDFKKAGNFWSENQAKELITENTLGKKPENALVPLVFLDDDFLANATSFSDAEKSSKTFFTDIQTFARVLNVEGLSEYADAISDNEGNMIFTYDPYVNKHTKRIEKYETVKAAIAEEKGFSPKQPMLKSSGNNPGNILWVADIAVGYMPNSIKGAFGHAGVVYKLNNGLNYGGNPNNSNTKTMEAVGDRPNTNDEVVEESYNSYWTSNNFNWLLLIYAPNLSWSERSDIKDYAKAQDPDTYSLSSPKWNTSSWYCSKLVWKSYKEKTNMDIDYDGGYYVYPVDMAYKAIFSSDIDIYYYYSK